MGSLKVTQEGLQELVDEGLCGADSVGMRWQRPWAGAHLGKPPGGAKVAGGRTLVVEGCFCHRLFSPAILSRGQSNIKGSGVSSETPLQVLWVLLPSSTILSASCCVNLFGFGSLQCKEIVFLPVGTF